MSNIIEYSNELRKKFLGEIRLDSATRSLYSTDASIYQILPHGVLVPQNQEDLILAVELAAKYQIPILPRGSGSSLAGQAIGEAIILDHSKYLNNLVGVIDKEGKEAMVEPGLILANLNRAAAKHALMFGPDPASGERATMGGVIGNNATGAHSILYGMTADHLVSCDVIHSDGTLATWGSLGKRPVQDSLFGRIANAAYDIHEKSVTAIQNNWPKTWRNSAGYRLNYLLPWSKTQPPLWEGAHYPEYPVWGDFNMAPLMAGSEGTLGIIRQARIKLVEKPKFTILAILAYTSIISACEDVPDLLKYQPSAIELIPQNLIQLAKSVAAYSKNLKYFNENSEAFLAIEFSGNVQEDLVKKCSLNRDVIFIADKKEDQENIWATRKVGLGLFDAVSNIKRPVAFIEDCAIPVENLGFFVKELHRIFEEYQVQASYYAHASAGCLHVRPVLDIRSEQGRIALREISTLVLQLTLSLGGAMSSEHGDGLARGEWITNTYGKDVYQLFKDFKHAADPIGILNPNKIIDTPLLDSNLRNYEQTPINLWEPTIDFDETGGYLRTVEKCNGQGVCRKESGVMCPSFQVTKDEVYSTRGRANLLREFLYNKNSALTTKDLKQTFDLCLACKGCKSECPSKVDVAKLKIAFMDKYYQDHPHSLRDFVFGYLPNIANLFSASPQLFNFGIKLVENISMLRKMIGISDRHSLPLMQNTNKIDNKEKTGKKKCILVTDAYNHFFDPQIEKDAIWLLDKMGIEAITTRTIGAGRTFLSKGFLPQAKKQIITLLSEIQLIDPEGVLPIIGLEPSEIYILKDEVFDITGGVFEREKLNKISERTFFIDEYLLRLVLQNDKFETEESKQTVLLHGHCHQKAQALSPDGYPVGVDATQTLLNKFGFNVQVLNTGCCGMAGSFGYEIENAEVSYNIASLTLLPSIKEKFEEGKTVLCSPGTSCRTQIKDGSHKQAFHTVELLNKVTIKYC